MKMNNKTIKLDIISKENFSILFFTFFYSLILYIVFITNNLTNQYDSLWVGKQFTALYNELECGRWMWVFVDIIGQGFKAEPIITVTSLLLFSIGNIFLIEALGLRKKMVKYFLSFIILSSTTVCCLLSYKHQSYMFAFSYLFSTIATYFTIKCNNSIKSIIISSFLLVLSLASYQSSIGCYCLLVLIFILYRLINDNIELENIFEVVIKVIICLLIGSIIYKILWDIILKIYNTSITGYKNANTLSIFNMIINFPHSIYKTYVYFFEYYTGKFVINAYPLIIKIIIVFIIVFFIKDLLKKKTINIFLSVLIFLLIPVASNFSVLYIDADVMLQQTLPCSMCIPLLLCIIFDTNFTNHSIIKQIYAISLILLSSVFFFGNVLATEKDLESLREGRNSTNMIVTSICSKLIDDGYCNKYNKFYFIGKPCDSILFKTCDMWNDSNDYAKFGDFWDNAFCLPNSYQGVINDLGYNIQCCFSSNEKFNELLKNEVVINMPAYPENNSIIVIDDYVVIKVANN